MAVNNGWLARASRRFGVGVVVVAAVFCATNLPATGSASAAVSGPAVASPPVVSPTAKNTGALQAVSCLPSRWCMAVGSSANNKSVAWVWEHGAWHQLNDPPGDGLVNVSCPTRTFCLAFNTDRLFDAVVWNGTTWRFMTPGPNSPKSDVSCPSSRFCAVINGVGAHKSGPIPETWNGQAWKSWKDICNTQPSACGDFDISCSSATTCVTVDAQPSAAVWNGKDWHISDLPAKNSVTIPTAVSCTGTFCLTIGDQTTSKAYVATYDASSQSWKNVSSSAHLPWPAPTCGGACFLAGTLSCATSTRCLTSGLAGFFAWNGHQFRPAPPKSAGRGSKLSRVACVKTFCLAVGYRTVNHVRKPLSELWNGTTWKILPQAS
ncbi:MAG TPA: hypothetical protein VGM14_26465 [Streptosporangiaceae bacterium]|jgi:hypothetical protein